MVILSFSFFPMRSVDRVVLLLLFFLLFDSFFFFFSCRIFSLIRKKLCRLHMGIVIQEGTFFFCFLDLSSLSKLK